MPGGSTRPGDWASADRPAVGAAGDRGGGDGAAADRGVPGPGGGGPVRLRCPVEVRGRGTGLRLSGGRAYGAGGYAGPAGPLGAAGPDLRGDPGSGPARPGWRGRDAWRKIGRAHL